MPTAIVQAGKLRQRVTVQQITLGTPDLHGQHAETWAAYPTSTSGKIWARVEPLRGNELIEAQQQAAEVTHRVTIRYLGGLTTDMRLLYGTRELQILSALNIDERGHMTQLLCKERP